MDIFTFLRETVVALTNVIAVRLLLGNKVFLLPKDWKLGDKISEDVTYIRSHDYQLKPDSILYCDGFIFSYTAPDNYKLIRLPE